jgi:hypothetical protein
MARISSGSISARIRARFNYQDSVALSNSKDGGIHSSYKIAEFCMDDLRTGLVTAPKAVA